MSRRLQRVLRDIDTIARLGGDEFAVLLTINADERGALAVAARIRESLEEAFQLGGISVQTSASIGVALYPDHASDAETLAQRADVAMYTAKRAGGGIALYSPEHDQSSVRRLALLGELRSAIEDDQLLLHYQPTLDLRTGLRTHRRSARALATSRAWSDAAGRVHRAGRGVGNDPGAHPVGHHDRDPSVGRVAAAWSRARGGGEPVSPQPLRARARAVACRRARAVRRRRKVARVRDHRERADGRSAARDGGAGTTQGARRGYEHRRLRYRLLVAVLPQASARSIS